MKKSTTKSISKTKPKSTDKIKRKFKSRAEIKSKTKSKPKVEIKHKSNSKVKARSKVKPRSRVATKARVHKQQKKAEVVTKIETNQQQKMSDVSLGYLIAGVFEMVMAIPFVGWLMGINSVGFFWVAGLVINIVALTIVRRSKKSISGNIFGIIANIIGWVPILGWFFHLVATILLFVFFFKEERG